MRLPSVSPSQDLTGRSTRGAPRQGAGSGLRAIAKIESSHETRPKHQHPPPRRPQRSLSGDGNSATQARQGASYSSGAGAPPRPTRASASRGKQKLGRVHPPAPANVPKQLGFRRRGAADAALAIEPLQTNTVSSSTLISSRTTICADAQGARSVLVELSAITRAAPAQRVSPW